MKGRRYLFNKIKGETMRRFVTLLLVCFVFASVLFLGGCAKTSEKAPEPINKMPDIPPPSIKPFGESLNETDEEFQDEDKPVVRDEELARVRVYFAEMNKIAWVSLDGSERGDVLEVDRAIPLASLSPDKVKILYVSNSDKEELFVCNLDGSGKVLIDNHVGSASWSPDSKKIAYTKYFVEDPRIEPKVAIFVSDVKGKSKKQLTAKIQAPIEVGPWFPDGGKVALFFGKYSGEVSGKAYALTMSGILTLLFEDAQVLDFSSDGNHMLFRRWRDSGREILFLGLWIAKVDGSNARKLVEAFRGLFSLDGKWVFCAGGEELLKVSIDSGGLQSLSHLPGFALNMTLTPDGDRIVLMCFDTSTQNPNICSLRSDGSDLRVALDLEAYVISSAFGGVIILGN